MTSALSESKVCSKCHIEKNISEFYIRSNQTVMSWCKQCCSIYYNQYSKKKWKTDLEYRERRKEYFRRYMSNPENALRHYKYNDHKKACKLIQKHHDEMKDDPDRLTTAFIQRIVGTRCDIEKEKVE